MEAGTPYERLSDLPDPAVAEYIAVELSRLARIASARNFGLLPYLIDMAVLEAWREASEPGPGTGEVDFVGGSWSGIQATD